jgi:hypothetical protein
MPPGGSAGRLIVLGVELKGTWIGTASVLIILQLLHQRVTPDGLTPNDVTQPRIRECLQKAVFLEPYPEMREQNLLADLPKDLR